MTLTRDANNHPIQYPKGVRYYDAKQYPFNPYASPATVDISGKMILTPHDGSLRLTYKANASSTVSDTTDGALGAFTVASGSEKTIPVLEGHDIYITSAAGTIVNFYFEVL